jgi:hypothetical protein
MTRRVISPATSDLPHGLDLTAPSQTDDDAGPVVFSWYTSMSYKGNAGYPIRAETTIQMPHSYLQSPTGARVRV